MYIPSLSLVKMIFNNVAYSFASSIDLLFLLSILSMWIQVVNIRNFEPRTHSALRLDLIIYCEIIH